MKRAFLILIALAVVALLIYRFIERRSVEATRTIALIQAEEGYPVEVEPAITGNFSMTRKFTGTVIGEKEAIVVSSLPEYISSISVREGQYVEKDAVICELSRDNPNAGYAQAKLAYDNIQKEFERIKKLHDEGAVSQQVLDGIRLQLDITAENLSTIEKLLYVQAPISGKITELQAEQGLYAAPGFPLAKIISTGKPRVQIKIPAADRALIKSGSACKISTDGASIKGKVERVSYSANPDGRTFSAWIDFAEKTDEFLFSPGLLVDVKINVLDVKDVTLISPNALIRDGEKWNTYKIEDNKAKLKSIEIGGQNSDLVWVKSGIEQGAKVVVSGANLLHDGALVRIITRTER
ncbi:efflux RND transporter periplasmic adaptor subunit [bacterium]|nr:efflux RND transporter periplasmic adaptor subunit [bacterium]